MKMQTLPIVPWIGGKRRLAKHILPLFPAHECYVEPFCGAAALYFLKTPGKIEVPRFYVSTSKSIIKALINMHSFEIQLSPIG